jgi:hypothetical protein
MEFIQTGEPEQAGTAAGTILAFLTTLEGSDAQLTALNDLRLNLESRCESAGISGPAQDRHIAVEDAIDQARITLEKNSG